MMIMLVLKLAQLIIAYVQALCRVSLTDSAYFGTLWTVSYIASAEMPDKTPRMFTGYRNDLHCLRGVRGVQGSG